MLEIGSIVDGKYKILRVVGKGGMSVVYQAVNEKANKIWAIKEVRKDGVQDFEVVKQNLIVETELLKRFNHPNLPSIIDVIDGDGTFLIVMDYIEGNSLSKALETGGAQSQDDVIEWSKQLCDVLGYLHSRKPPIIYRDMKPSNVMLKPDGNVSLIDFGTAREFKSSSVEDTKCLGTQGYAAPEQYGGQGQTDERTDIYCLGATMYHLVTGHNPSTYPYQMYPIRQWNPMLSSGLEEIIIKCTQPKPEDRYQSCAELLYALDHYQDLDVENKKVQSFKWKTFLASTIITIVMLIGTIGFSIATSAITQAENKESADLYLKAIDVDKGNIDAYKGLLNLYMNDQVLSEDEYQTLLSVVTENEDELKSRDAEAFADDFSLELANDLFFCLNGNGESKGIMTSAKWYKKVVDLSADEKNIEKATLMMNFANNYETRTTVNKKGESTISIDEYWNTLETMADPDLMSKENIVVALKCYQFVANDLLTQNDWFRNNGLSESQYSEMLSNLKTYTQNITNTTTYKSNEISYSQLVDSIYNTINAAEDFGYGNKSNSNSNSESAGE
jgi:serine/threonine-protein kinase